MCVLLLQDIHVQVHRWVIIPLIALEYDSVLTFRRSRSEGRPVRPAPISAHKILSMATRTPCVLHNLPFRSVLTVNGYEIALSADFTQLRAVVSYPRFGTAHWYRLQGSSLKMGPIGCPETSARNYHSTLRKIPKEGRFQFHDIGSPK